MSIHVPRDPEFAARIRENFAQQAFMATLGARLVRVEPGEVDIAISFRDDLTQQNGFLHAGAITSVIDSACGYAAFSLMEAGSNVLSVEFKVNMLAPAVGTEFLATGKVIRSGRTITVCSGELRAGETLVSIMQATMMCVRR